LTLVEVVVALGISVLAVAGIVSGYLFSIVSAQRSALSLVAGAKAVERMEETAPNGTIRAGRPWTSWWRRIFRMNS
jgi:type II secretory pathway pseudopilin PulG